MLATTLPTLDRHLATVLEISECLNESSPTNAWPQQPPFASEQPAFSRLARQSTRRQARPSPRPPTAPPTIDHRHLSTSQSVTIAGSDACTATKRASLSNLVCSSMCEMCIDHQLASKTCILTSSQLDVQLAVRSMEVSQVSAFIAEPVQRLRQQHQHQHCKLVQCNKVRFRSATGLRKKWESRSARTTPRLLL